MLEPEPRRIDERCKATGEAWRPRCVRRRSTEDAFSMTTPTSDEKSGSRHESPSRVPSPGAVDLEPLLQKLKLLGFGLYGLQQYGRNATLDVEDIGPFYRLAEEIESDVLELQRKLAPAESTETS
jgi:hypothetical protein